MVYAIFLFIKNLCVVPSTIELLLPLTSMANHVAGIASRIWKHAKTALSHGRDLLIRNLLRHHRSSITKHALSLPAHSCWLDAGRLANTRNRQCKSLPGPNLLRRAQLPQHFTNDPRCASAWVLSQPLHLSASTYLPCQVSRRCKNTWLTHS